jgi:hypothetical protein
LTAPFRKRAQCATRIDPVINPKTRQGVSLEVPSTLIAIADEVVE